MKKKQRLVKNIYFVKTGHEKRAEKLYFRTLFYKKENERSVILENLSYKLSDFLPKD